MSENDYFDCLDQIAAVRARLRQLSYDLKPITKAISMGVGTLAVYKEDEMIQAEVGEVSRQCDALSSKAAKLRPKTRYLQR